MRLTHEEKVAGRLFRDQSQNQLADRFAADPPTFEVPWYLGSFRHDCPARDGRSTSIELREVYLYSPAMNTVDDGSGPWLAIPADEASVPNWGAERQIKITSIDAGRFGFIYRTGTCKGCGATARSRSGRLVDGKQRPPIHKRAARG